MLVSLQLPLIAKLHSMALILEPSKKIFTGVFAKSLMQMRLKICSCGFCFGVIDLQKPNPAQQPTIKPNITANCSLVSKGLKIFKISNMKEL